MRNRLWVLSLLACVVGTVVACSEDLTGTAGCPELCPEQDIDSRDTILDAFLTVDTTVTGYPSEPRLNRTRVERAASASTVGRSR